MNGPHFVYSVHLLIDIQVISTLGLLWIVLLWTFMKKFLLEPLFFVILGMWPSPLDSLHLSTRYCSYTIMLHVTPSCVLFQPFLKLKYCSVVKNLPANARHVGSIPGPGRSPRVGNGNPLQYSGLENPMDRGAWRATVHQVAESQTWLSEWTATIVNLQCCVSFRYTEKWFSYIDILFQILFHYSLLHDIDYNSLCYTVPFSNRKFAVSLFCFINMLIRVTLSLKDTSLMVKSLLSDLGEDGAAVVLTNHEVAPRFRKPHSSPLLRAAGRSLCPSFSHFLLGTGQGQRQKHQLYTQYSYDWPTSKSPERLGCSQPENFVFASRQLSSVLIGFCH